MSRRGLPTEKYITELLTEAEPSGQGALDREAMEQNLQTNIKTVAADGKDTQGKAELKGVGSGIVGFMQDQDVSILHTRPYGTVIAFGGKEAERHASQKVEPWVNSAVWLGMYGKNIWDTGIQRLQGFGRTWWKVLPLPEQWRREELKEIINERNNATTEEARDKAKEREREYKSNPANFPITVLGAAPRSTWPVYDERPGIAEVVEKVKMKRADVEGRMGIPKDFKQKEFDVVHYANDVYVASVLSGGKKWLGLANKDPVWLAEPWEHGLEVNPYVLAEGSPVLDNDEGWVWRSSTFNVRKLIPASDEVLTSYGNSIRRSARTPYFVKADYQARVDNEIAEKQIVVEEGKTVQMLVTEEAGLFPTPQVNPDALRFFSLLQTHMDVNMMGREAQSGQTLSGQSAVSQEQARQVANGRLAIPHASAEVAFAQICERFLRCVVSLEKDFPDAEDVVTIREEVKGGEFGNKGREISVTGDDVKDFFHSIRGKIKLNIAINENQNVTNARQSTDKSQGMPLLSDASALVRYYDHEDPEGEFDKKAEEQMVIGVVQTLIATAQKRITGGVEQMSGPDLQALIERGQGLPQASQQALQQALGQDAGMMETIGRSAANKPGQSQALSNLGGGAQ